MGLAIGCLRHLDAELDRALLVRAQRVADVARVDCHPVVGQQDLTGHLRHALDADENVHHRHLTP
jgi:hypothetical protein